MAAKEQYMDTNTTMRIGVGLVTSQNHDKHFHITIEDTATGLLIVSADLTVEEFGLLVAGRNIKVQGIDWSKHGN